MQMKAVRLHDYGGPEVLHYEDAPIPEPESGDVLIRVHATSVNPVDWKIREGHVREHIRYKLPLTLGWDVSGVVERAGANAERFAIGASVYGRPDITRDGAYAQYVVVREAELASKPATLDHTHAAAVPFAGLTAWQTLFEAPTPMSDVALQPGQRLLIHGAAGGVGTWAVQLAKWRCAHVIATASAHNHEFLRELGADEVIDYTRDAFEDVVSPVDAVIDLIGGETHARSWKVIKRGGVLASVITPPSDTDASRYGVRAAYVFIQANPEHLARLAQLIDAGTIRPIVSEILPLASAREAHELSQAGHVRGKIVLLP